MNVIFEQQDNGPRVEDQMVLAYCFYSQGLRTAIVQIVLTLGSQALDKLSWVAILLIQRMVECQLSFELLVSRGRERDAAVLLTTILELAFDLMYLEKHPDKVEEWISHSNLARKPWAVSLLINDIYDDDERKPMSELYRYCSMVKHGNPVGGVITFPIGIKDRELILMKNSNCPMLTAYVFAAVGNIHRALQSAVLIWKRGGHDAGSNVEVADTAWHDLQRLNTRHIRDMVVDLMRTQPAAFEVGGPLEGVSIRKKESHPSCDADEKVNHE